MVSLDALVAQVQALSSTPNDLSHLQTLLNQAESSLSSDSSCLGPSLEQLDPERHTLGYLYILDLWTTRTIPKEEAGGVILTICRFIGCSTEQQIHLARDKFVSVCKRLRELSMLLGSPIRGVAPMRIAIRKLQTSPEHLSSLHPEFLLLCILSKCYKIGLTMLEDDIFEVDQSRDFFLYCYYGGVICIGNKLFPKALELLHNVVTAPMNSLNAIAVEAYKKYILVSLIQNGQFSTTFPKYSSSAVQRNMKNLSEPYSALSNAYGTADISKLKECARANEEQFSADNNLGLVGQVVASLYKRNIQRLTQTYLTLSLEDIARRAGLNDPKEAEFHVLQMIEDVEIHAVINQKDGMVRFLEDPEEYKTCGAIDRIDSSIQRVMWLSGKLKHTDDLISCDPLYQSKVGRERQQFDLDDFDGVPQRLGH